MTTEIQEANDDNGLEQIINDIEAIESVDEVSPDSDTPTEATQTTDSIESAEVTPEAEATASVAVGLLESAICMAYPMLEYDDETRLIAVEKLAPVFAKYGGAMPLWLAAIQPEIKAVLFFAGIGYGSYMQIKAAKLAEAANDDQSIADDRADG